MIGSLVVSLHENINIELTDRQNSLIPAQNNEMDHIVFLHTHTHTKESIHYSFSDNDKRINHLKAAL